MPSRAKRTKEDRKMMKTTRRSYLGVLAVLVAMALMLTLQPVARAAPANDNFADALTISGQSVSVDGSNAGATIESGEDRPADSSSSVWYSWTAPVTGQVKLDTCTSFFDT